MYSWRTPHPILSLCLCVLFSLSVDAQPFESILAYRAHYHFPTEYDKPNEAPGDKFGLFQQTADLTVPIPLKTRYGQSLIIAGMFYNHFRFDALTDGTSQVREKFHRTTFKVGVSYPWNEKHRTTVIFLPTFAAQVDVFNGRSFQPGFLGVHSIVINDRLTLKVGLYYNREVYKNFFMPLLGIDWRLNNDWYIFGLLPGTANIYKKVNDWFAFSISERAPNGSILANDSPGDFLSYGSGTYALFMFDMHFTPFIFDLLGNESDLTFTLSVGHSMLRDYHLNIGGFDTYSRIETGPFFETKSAPYVKFMVSVRLWP